MILAFIEDLLFTTKVQQAARLVGVTVQPGHPSWGPEVIAAREPSALILDLNHPSISAVDFVRSLKAHERTRAIPIVGFVSHVQSDVIAAAHEAGCDQVLARSEFSQQLPQLLREFAGKKT